MAGKITKEELHSLLSQKIDDFAAHEAESMPHRFTDGSVTYRYGWKVVSGELRFVYEEVV